MLIVTIALNRLKSRVQQSEDNKKYKEFHGFIPTVG